MANEITIQAVLAFQRFSPGMQAAATKDVTAANSLGASIVQTLSTTETALNLGTLGAPPANLYYIFVKNLDATIDVELSTPDAGAGNWIFALLQPDQFCIVPVKGGRTIKAKAASGTPKILICAAST